MQPKSRGRFRWGLLVMTLLVLRCAGAWAADADTIVDRASRQVTAFLDQMSDVKCSEHVTQLKLDKNGHTAYQENSSFDYLVLLQGSGDELLLNESRLGDAHNQQRNKKNVPLLITNGFSMLMLIFHPYYRNSFEFAAMPDEIVAGHRTVASPVYPHSRNAHAGGAGGSRQGVSSGIDGHGLDRAGNRTGGEAQDWLGERHERCRIEIALCGN